MSLLLGLHPELDRKIFDHPDPELKKTYGTTALLLDVYTSKAQYQRWAPRELKAPFISALPIWCFILRP
jgi:hypothetical protein